MEAVTPRKYTVEEYLGLAASAGWHSTELLDGRVIKMAPEYALHANTVEHVAAVLRSSLVGVRVRDHGSVRFGQDTLLQPDVFVMSSDGPVGMQVFDGTTCVLVVEVSASTRERDLVEKSAVYALTGVPEYWVIDPQLGLLQQHRDPVDGAYRSRDETPVGYAAEDLDTGLVRRLAIDLR